MLSLVLALGVPPHGRVNQRCYPVWNRDRSNLRVVWDGVEYAQPWAFSVEVANDSDTCLVDACVQRLFCTDSGAVGRYTVDRRQRHADRSVVLAYAWLRNASVRGSRLLVAEGREGGSALMRHTNEFGHGSVLVAGDTLFFYTYDVDLYDMAARYGLPRLSSLVFAAYEEGKAADELVAVGLDAVNVLGVSDAYRWYSQWSPIYPSGRDALTVSVEYSVGWSNAAIDAALTLTGGTGVRRGALVHQRSDMPSVRTAAREVLTAPGYSCRATMDETPPLCYVLGAAAHYTWGSEAATQFGVTFRPLGGERRFSLPAALWLFDAGSDFSFFKDYRVLAAFGLGSVVAFDGDVFHGVEVREAPGCPRGGLFLVSYAVGDALAQRSVSALLACARGQEMPDSSAYEAPYEAAAVKWLGPWEEGHALFVAESVADHEYAGPVPTRRGCGLGHYPRGETCLPCLPGHVCSGLAPVPCPAGTHQLGNACAQCPRGTASLGSAASCSPCPVGYSSERGAALCTPCADGSACAGGAAQETCALHLGRGAASCQPCPEGFAWHLGTCVRCAGCSTRREAGAVFRVA